MRKILLYLQMHQLKEQGFKKAAIARKLGVARNTVDKYLKMSYEEFIEWVNSLENRAKKLDPFRDLILSWLKEHPDLSSSQIEDRLLEKYPTLVISESTVRKYVRGMRDFHHIPKVTSIRQFEAVEELPMGKQAQVDWGEITVKNAEKKEVKLYFISFVLSHSRYKYAEWQGRPFTTKDTIRCHENAFQYFGGMPDELVYDQDHLITVSENAGDHILTSGFQAYKTQRKFRMYLCRKADPQSKGKIENVVKYIKQNFAKHRVFSNIDAWNESFMGWLKRTGNYKIHHTIKKRPVEVFAVEKPHLNPVSPLLSEESNHVSSITRTVYKNNVIKFHSNRYSVPLGTYRPRGDNKVSVELIEEELIIKSSLGEVLARHTLCKEKGKLIKSRQHSRDRSKGIQAYKETVIRQFKDQEKASLFIQKVHEQYARHIRDQLQVAQAAVHQYRQVADEALHICIERNLWSANDLRDAAMHLSLMKKKESAPLRTSSESKTCPVSSSPLQATAHVRELHEYIQILGGSER